MVGLIQGQKYYESNFLYLSFTNLNSLAAWLLDEILFLYLVKDLLAQNSFHQELPFIYIINFCRLSEL